MTPLLPLETFRDVIGYNPWHFWGLAGDKAPVTNRCNSVVFKYAWQNTDAAGREEIIRAIESAENKLSSYLKYSPAPHFKTDVLQYPRYPDEQIVRMGYYGADNRWTAIRLSEGFIQKVGVETRTLLGTPALTYSDTDADGLNDTWVATIATTVTDPSQLAVYFSAADRPLSAALGEKFRITPVSITIAAGTATIRGRSWQMVKPALYESGLILDPSIAGNFATTIDVCWYYCDPTGSSITTAQAMMEWGSSSYPDCLSPFSTDPAAVMQATGRVGIRDALNGIVELARGYYNVSTGVWSTQDICCQWPPERVTVRYLAGKPLQSDGRMDARMTTVFSHFGAAELARPICACVDANRELYLWQFDLARTGGSDGESYTLVSSGDLDNPFGTRRGQVDAWKELKGTRLLTGFVP